MVRPLRTFIQSAADSSVVSLSMSGANFSTHSVIASPMSVELTQPVNQKYIFSIKRRNFERNRIKVRWCKGKERNNWARLTGMNKSDRDSVILQNGAPFPSKPRKIQSPVSFFGRVLKGWKIEGFLHVQRSPGNRVTIRKVRQERGFLSRS
jgi:hypothetical protein